MSPSPYTQSTTTTSARPTFPGKKRPAPVKAVPAAVPFRYKHAHGPAAALLASSKRFVLQVSFDTAPPLVAARHVQTLEFAHPVTVCRAVRAAETLLSLACSESYLLARTGGGAGPPRTPRNMHQRSRGDLLGEAVWLDRIEALRRGHIQLHCCC